MGGRERRKSGGTEWEGEQVRGREKNVGIEEDDEAWDLLLTKCHLK